MFETTPGPNDLRDSPELSAIFSLRVQIDLAESALLAAYPELEMDNSCPAYPYCTARVAYASALLHQLQALVGTVDELMAIIQNQRNPAFLVGIQTPERKT